MGVGWISPPPDSTVFAMELYKALIRPNKGTLVYWWLINLLKKAFFTGGGGWKGEESKKNKIGSKKK